MRRWCDRVATALQQWCATVVRDSGTRVQQYAPCGGLPRVAARLAKGSCKTSQGVSDAIFY